MPKDGIIYIATNIINGKSYIGKTIQTLKQRKQSHIRYAKEGGMGVFLSALRKYGIENFKWEILCECDKDILGITETMKIIVHNSHYIDGYGYNMTYGGEGCLGYKHSEIARKKISKSKIGQNNPMYNKTTIGFSGHSHTEESKKNISKNLSKSWKALSKNDKEKRLKEFTDNRGTEESRKKLSKSLMGHESSIERNKKISESLKRYNMLKKENKLL